MSDNAGARIYALEHPLTPRSLREKLEARRVELMMQLRSAQDWDDFKRRVGRIEGIEEAIVVCEDIENPQEKR